MSELDPVLEKIIRDLRNPSISVDESETALIEYIRKCEKETWQEAADMVQNSGDYGYDGWHSSSLSTAAYELRQRAEELDKTP